MKYKVPIYKLCSKNEILMGEVVVDKTSLGVYEVVTNHKIHIFSGMIELSQFEDKKGLFNFYVRDDDLIRKNLVFTEKSQSLEIPDDKICKLKDYQEKQQDLLKLIKKAK